MWAVHVLLFAGEYYRHCIIDGRKEEISPDNDILY